MFQNLRKQIFLCFVLLLLPAGSALLLQTGCGNSQPASTAPVTIVITPTYPPCVINGFTCTPSPTPSITPTPSNTPTPCPTSYILGDTNIETVFGPLNSVLYQRYQAGATGNLVNISFYVSGGTYGQLGLYSDSSTLLPNALLGKTTVFAPPGGAQWVTQWLLAPVSVTSGTYYWLAISTDGTIYSSAGSHSTYGQPGTGLISYATPSPIGPGIDSVYGTICP